MDAHALTQFGGKQSSCFLRVGHADLHALRMPIALRCGERQRIKRYSYPTASRNGAHLSKEAVVRVFIACAQVLACDRVIHTGLETGHMEKLFDFRGNGNHSLMLPRIEWLNTQPVPAQNYLIARCIEE